MIPFARNVRTGLAISPMKADPRDSFVCFDCSEPLTLRRGTVRAPHFAHRPLRCGIRNCRIDLADSKESIEHLTAKIILARDLQHFSFRRVCMNCAKVTTGDWKSLIYDDAKERFADLIEGYKLEYRFGSRVVDAMREFVKYGDGDSASNCYFVIEIRKTHAVDQKKFEELRKNSEISGICEVSAQQVLDASQNVMPEVQDLLPWTCGCRIKSPISVLPLHADADKRVAGPSALVLPILGDNNDKPWPLCTFCKREEAHSGIQGCFVKERPIGIRSVEDAPDIIFACSTCLREHVGDEYDACFGSDRQFLIVQGCRFSPECIWKHDF